MVGPVKEPYCRVHRENFPMLLVRNYSLTVNIRPLSPIQPNLSWVAFGVLPAVRLEDRKEKPKAA